MNDNEIYNEGSGYEKEPNDLARLMHDFRETDPSKMYFKFLSETADYLKNTEEGNEKMASIIEEIKEEGKLELISELFSRGFSFQEISDLFPDFNEEQLKLAQREALQNF